MYSYRLHHSFHTGLLTGHMDSKDTHLHLELQFTGIYAIIINICIPIFLH